MGTLDKRIKIIRQQLQDAKRTGDREYAAELQQELDDLEHQEEGDDVATKLKKEHKVKSSFATRVLSAEQESVELVDQGSQGELEAKLSEASKAEAAYEGSKVADLIQYLKGLAPQIRFPAKRENAGPATRDPSVRDAYTTKALAYALGSALIADGWYGEKRKMKVKPAQWAVDKARENLQPLPKPEIREYIYYVPSSENGVEYKSLRMPYVKMFKPAKGQDRVCVTIGQATTASERELVYLNKLNRMAQRMFRDRHQKKKGGGPRAGW